MAVMNLARTHTGVGFAANSTLILQCGLFGWFSAKQSTEFSQRLIAVRLPVWLARFQSRQLALEVYNSSHGYGEGVRHRVFNG